MNGKKSLEEKIELLIVQYEGLKQFHEERLAQNPPPDRSYEDGEYKGHLKRLEMIIEDLRKILES